MIIFIIFTIKLWFLCQFVSRKCEFWSQLGTYMFITHNSRVEKYLRCLRSHPATYRVILAERRITPRGLNFSGLTAAVADSCIMLYFPNMFISPYKQRVSGCVCVCVYVFLSSTRNFCLPPCLTSSVAPIWPVFFFVFFWRGVGIHDFI